MPYIKQEDREKIREGNTPKNAGELNYRIHLLLDDYVIFNGESYQTYNDMIGALEGIKLELYRRRVSKYEIIKIESNGDIPFYEGF